MAMVCSAMSAMRHLVDLPDEVLLSIVVKLSLADILSLILSCRRFFVLIVESSLMQYLIRVLRNGLYDPLVSDMPIPQRTEALETWERTWLSLSMNKPSQHYQLSAIGLEDSKKCTVHSGILIGTQFNKLYLSGAYCYLDFLHLLNPSKDLARISIPNVGSDTHVQSWTYAPESDLMAIIFNRRSGPPQLHILQFSTGIEHAKATNCYLEFDQISTTRATCMECCGDNIIAVILDGESMEGENSDYIFVVDWRIGRITQLRKSQPGTYGALVTFLSRDILLFALRDAFELQICKLNRGSGDATPTLHTLCSLRLPCLLGGQQIADLRLSQPSPLSGDHPSPRRSHSEFPFRSDPEDNILAFDVYFRDDHGRRIIFVARRRALLSLAFPLGTGPSVLPSTKAWEDWGPRATHWMELDPLNDSISLAGSRCVLVKYSHLRSHFVLDLREFNPYRVRTRGARHGKSTPITSIASRMVLSAGACFEEDVVSELPFLSIRKENVGSRVLLDDEWMAEILWDRDIQAQVIQFRTITSATEP